MIGRKRNNAQTRKQKGEREKERMRETEKLEKSGIYTKWYNEYLKHITMAYFK